MQANKSKTLNFKSLDNLVRFLERQATRVPKLEKILLETIGTEVEKNAKAKIGHYQEAIGGFNQWEELKESTKLDRVRKNYPPNDPLLRDGTLRDSISHTVQKNVVSVGSSSDIMVYQELGTKNNIPPRPVIGPAMFEKKARIQALAAELLFALLTDQLSKVR